MMGDPSGWLTRLDQAMVERYTRSGQWRNVTLARTAADWARRDPDRILAVDGEATLSYGQVYERGVRLAAALRARGLRPGDVVSFQLPNWHEAMVINLACCIAGFVCNPIVPIYRDVEVGYILAHSRTRALFIPGIFRSIDYQEMVQRLRPELPELGLVALVRTAGEDSYEQLLAEQAHADVQALAASFPAVDPNAVKLLLFTSGTTGDPKGVLHSHNTLGAEIDAATAFWRLREDDVVLMPSPITHITGYLYALEMPFALGMRVVLMERWDAAAAVDVIARHGCSFMMAATPFLVELGFEVEKQGRPLPSLRLFGSGGAPVPAEVVRRATQALPHCLTFRVYGSSEAPTVSLGVRAGDDPARGAVTDGAIANHEARIVDAVTGAPLGAGEEGEIVTRGPELMLGYTKPEYTAESFDGDGYFHTGDIGFIDADGYITVSGRKKDLIIRGGENISPKQIEEILHQHPAVQEAAIVAMPHPRMGETPCAYLVLRPGASLDFAGMVQFLEQARLAKQKFPERLCVVDEMPRTASGKVLKHVLRARAAAQAALPARS